MNPGGADPRLLRANEELRRLLQLIEHPSAKDLPHNVYQALERRMQRWARVVERLISEPPPDAAPTDSQDGGRSAA